MDHKAYENEMIDSKWNRVVNKNDAVVVVRGLKRTIFALLTAGLFAISVIGLITVATAPGYLAVILFFASILGIVMAFMLLYAQGIANKDSRESSGDSK